MPHAPSLPSLASASSLRIAPRVATVARVAFGVLLLVAASHLRLPFALTPVPFTLQPQAVLLLAATLGSAEALAAVVAWFSLGVLGAPVFASALPGTLALVGPTGGYLCAYLPVAWFVGRYGRGHDVTAAAAWLAGTMLTLALGAAWLTQFVGISAALSTGVWPFAAADLYKASGIFLLRRATRQLPTSPRRR